MTNGAERSQRKIRNSGINQRATMYSRDIQFTSKAEILTTWGADAAQRSSLDDKWNPVRQRER